MNQHNRAARLCRLFFSTLYISSFTFGGGFVIVTLMKKKFVDELHWITEEEMLDMTALAESAPGAIAVNAAILVGWQVEGLLGMITAVVGTILPPMVILSIISYFYNVFAANVYVALVLKGMQAGVAAVILDVVCSMGGKVIAQVKNYVASGSVDRTQVVVPGNLVDAVVVSENPEENHRQTPGSYYNPVLAGHYKLDGVGFASLPFDERKVIARRASLELKPNSVVNLGIGIPEGVAAVAAEEGAGDQITLSIESGLTGGVPTGGQDCGCAVNAWAALPMTSQFDYYNGGNLAMTCLGFAEVDSAGNVNVSRFGSRIAGCGGLVDISQSTHNVIFCGTMTAGGLKEEIRNGKLVILQEGKKVKFKKSVEQITFSADFSRKKGQHVLFITERCVFELRPEGVTLTEIAPGIDLQTQILDQMEFVPKMADEIKTMDARIFRDELMGLAND